MSFCGETNNTLFFKKLPNSNFVHSCPNLSVPLWQTPTTSPLLPHKPSLCSLTCTSYTKHSGLWVRLRWHSNFHVQKETRKFVRAAVSPFIPRQGRDDIIPWLLSVKTGLQRFRVGQILLILFSVVWIY